MKYGDRGRRVQERLWGSDVFVEEAREFEVLKYNSCILPVYIDVTYLKTLLPQPAFYSATHLTVLFVTSLSYL